MKNDCIIMIIIGAWYNSWQFIFNITISLFELAIFPKWLDFSFQNYFLLLYLDVLNKFPWYFSNPNFVFFILFKIFIFSFFPNKLFILIISSFIKFKNKTQLHCLFSPNLTLIVLFYPSKIEFDLISFGNKA